MANKGTLYREAFLEINVVSEGQALQGDMTDQADKKWRTLFAEFTRMGKAPYDFDAIPDEYIEPLGIMLASRLARAYGVDEQRRQFLLVDAFGEQNPQSALNRYYRMLRAGTAQDSGTQEAGYY